MNATTAPETNAKPIGWAIPPKEPLNLNSAPPGLTPIVKSWLPLIWVNRYWSPWIAPRMTKPLSAISSMIRQWRP